jgi:methionyl aminopeptidase
MIQIKTDEEIDIMRESAKLAAEVLWMIEPYVKPGITTNRLNDICHDYIVSHGAVPSPLDYRGFPKSICSSINEEICHGIPSERKLRSGNIKVNDIAITQFPFRWDPMTNLFIN